MLTLEKAIENLCLASRKVQADADIHDVLRESREIAVNAPEQIKALQERLNALSEKSVEAPK